MDLRPGQFIVREHAHNGSIILLDVSTSRSVCLVALANFFILGVFSGMAIRDTEEFLEEVIDEEEEKKEQTSEKEKTTSKES